MVETIEKSGDSWSKPRDEISIEELRLVAAVFQGQEKDWAEQSRAVYTGESMERELDELFPVEVGLQALGDLHKTKEGIE